MSIIMIMSYKSIFGRYGEMMHVEKSFGEMFIC